MTLQRLRARSYLLRVIEQGDRDTPVLINKLEISNNGKKKIT